MKLVMTVLVLLVACGSRHDPEPTNPVVAEQPAGPDCAGAANHLVTFQTNGGDKQKASAAVAASCQKTKWTAAAIDCVKALKSLDDAPTCMHEMTVEQNLALEDIANNSAGSN